MSRSCQLFSCSSSALSQAFKSGIILAGSADPALKPEQVDAVEIGIKSQFADNRVRLNASAFHYDYKDLQVGHTNPAPTGFTTVFENAGASTIRGFDLEASFAVAEALRVDAAVGYLHARFDDYVSGNPLESPVIPRQLAGNTMVNAPNYTGNLRVSYTVPVPDGSLSVNAEGSYKDRVYFTAFNEQRMSQPGVTLLDAQIKYALANDRFDVSLWGKNLTNELVWSTLFPVSTSRTILGTELPPRTFGASATYRF